MDSEISLPVEVLEFFIQVNKTERYLAELKDNDVNAYITIRNKAASFSNPDLEWLVYDCLFWEDLKVVCYTMENVDIGEVVSDFERGKKKTEGMRLRFWRDFLAGRSLHNKENLLLHLNFFTLFAGRQGNKADIANLANIGGLESFIYRKNLAKALMLSTFPINIPHLIEVQTVGQIEEYSLMKVNTSLREKLSTGGGKS